MSKTLENLKEAMAVEEGFDTWADLEYQTNFTSMKILWERLSERYADQRVSEALNEYKEKLKAKFHEGWLNPDLICNEIDSTT